jgi:iron complex outermembrane receptor protein
VFADEYASGGDAFLASYGIAPHWRPAVGVEVVPLWSRIDAWGRAATPIYVTDRPFLPEPVRRRAYPGPRWADQRNVVTHYGTLAKARVGDWLLTGGIFRSSTDTPRNHANILTALSPDGLATRRITRDPRQRIGSTSGEARVSRVFTDGARSHTLHLSYRARDRRSLYGGGAAIEFGRSDVDAPIAPFEPVFATGPQTREHVTQHTGGVGYDGRWRSVGSLSLGLQRTGYAKLVTQPGGTPMLTRDPAWLYNGTLAIELSSRLALYGGHTRGLEESGIAPDGPANRTQVLPAILTSQSDAGLRWALRGGAGCASSSACSTCASLTSRPTSATCSPSSAPCDIAARSSA